MTDREAAEILRETLERCIRATTNRTFSMAYDHGKQVLAIVERHFRGTAK